MVRGLPHSDIHNAVIMYGVELSHTCARETNGECTYSPVGSTVVE